MYLAALHKIPSQTLDSLRNFARLIFQKQPKKSKK